MENGFPTMTATEILMNGLRLVYTTARIDNVEGDSTTSATNIQRFKDHFGCSHFVAARIWEDLQTADVPVDLVHPKKHSIAAFLEALNFLYRYRREVEREAVFDKSRKTLRKWSWYYLKRIQTLKQEKITFPNEFKEGDVWIMSVDGTHCLANEPIHPEFSQDREYFSHKKKHAGFCYELGIHLYESRLIWMNGPFPAGPNDNGNFARQGGLKEKLASIGKKALGDKGYTGHSSVCSTFNAMDSPEVKKLKSRAQMRHEQFNGMLKEFSSLDDRHRHKEAKFKICFESACVICQYRLENGEALFDLLAGIRVNESYDEESDSDDEESDDDSDEESAEESDEE